MRQVPHYMEFAMNAEFVAAYRLVRTIWKMRKSGMLYREIDEILDLPMFAPGSGYRTMKTAFARRVVSYLESRS